MLSLVPDSASTTQCPVCQTENRAAGPAAFAGAVTFRETTCSACQTIYYQTLPVGQFNRFPVAISTDGQHTAVAPRGRWLLPTVRAHLAGLSQPASLAIDNNEIRVESRRNTVPTDVMLLICLDACYGHGLIMLFNAHRHHHQQPDRALVVVVPKALAWLVPDYVAEVWIIDTPLSALKRGIAGFDAWINRQLTRFRSVVLSDARIHFDHRTTRFADFTRTAKFDLNQFDTLPVHLTFVLREDRLWLRYGWEQLLFRVVNRLGLLKTTRGWWLMRQNQQFRQLAGHIQQHLPQARLTAVGLGKAGGLGGQLTDARQPAPLPTEVERQWCSLYARSQVVVGVHGSGLLLPTSLAAGFISLLPPDKLAHYAEDVLLAHDNPIHQTLLGRFLPTSTSPRQVAAYLITMVTEFGVWLAEARERSAQDGE